MNKDTAKQRIHQLPAGLLVGDKSTELIGCPDTKKVFFLSNGNTRPFAELDKPKKAKLFEKMLSDTPAMNDLKGLSFDKALESFSFCVFGAADASPDFDINGNLKTDDNFLCSNNCKCLKWESKNITVDGKKITPRQLEIIQLLATDLAYKQIADQLEISEATVDTHRSNIFKLFNVHSRAGIVTKAMAQKIIQ